MRIAVIAPPWVPVPPPAYGGTEAVLDNLARGLQAAGHDVLLCASGDSTCDVSRRWARATAAGTVATGAATELHHVINAYGAIHEWGADLVHDHTLVGPVYAERFAVPVVTTNHGPFHGELGDLYRAIAGRVAVIAISRHHASTAGEIPVAAVIHHGLDVDTFPLGDGDGGYALFLGRMSRDKGVDVAVRVAGQAGVPLRIAAKMREPAEVAFFKQHIAPMLGDGVEYVGEIGGQDKLALLAGARCLINPIAWPEPFGMVMIEALASGTPVVATPKGSAPEIVTDAVTGFIADNEADLADGVVRAGELDRSACRKDVAARFSTERMVADHLHLFTRIARRAAGKGHASTRSRDASMPVGDQHGGMSDGDKDDARHHWQQFLERVTTERDGDEVTIEVLSRDFGDGLEVQRLPLASLAYDPKDDVAIVAIGGRDSRIPVVLRHLVTHPQQIVAEAVAPDDDLVVEIVDGDGDRTFVTLHHPSTDGSG
jgi:glycosyltransferase involved in cell wall biosynthesis